MMVFAVYDSAAEAYGLPFFLKSTGEAVRSFQDATNDPKSQLSKHPADFTLFEIGRYNELQASFDLLVTPKSLGKAIEYVKAQ